ncbi:MAG: hypothetical protein E7559_06080 [Ruminococcaceae bacterium]|nr:hypothetical protein [Oscillospiraceae bacterium]
MKSVCARRNQPKEANALCLIFSTFPLFQIFSPQKVKQPMYNLAAMLPHYWQNRLRGIRYARLFAIRREGFVCAAPCAAYAYSMGFDFNGRERRKSKNASFYIAVGLCCAAVCLVAVSAYLNRDSVRAPENYISLTENDSYTPENNEIMLPPEPPEQTSESAAPMIEGLSEDTPEAEYPEPQDAGAMGGNEAEWSETVQEKNPPPVQEETLEVMAEPAVFKLTFAPPLNGKQIKPFSGSELIFCSTMGDWRVHEGLDIAGEAGAEVRAAADGIAVDFIEDMLYGHTAVIQHADGSMLYYCGLNSTRLISKGLEVKAGDVIGFLGEVPCEAKDGPHLHLALMRDGGFSDPAEFFQK